MLAEDLWDKIAETKRKAFDAKAYYSPYIPVEIDPVTFQAKPKRSGIFDEIKTIADDMFP